MKLVKARGWGYETYDGYRGGKAQVAASVGRVPMDWPPTTIEQRRMLRKRGAYLVQ